jgi:23S rRNA (guanosine2251-2'-O)-methyltransferase
MSQQWKTGRRPRRGAGERYGERPRERPPAAAPARPERRSTATPQPARPRGELQPWLYGRHAVAAALANPQRRVKRLVSLAEGEAEARALASTAFARLPSTPLPEILTAEALSALLPPDAVHQGLALLAAPLPEPAIEDVLDRLGDNPAAGQAPQIIVLLDQVTDPHNVGAVLRSAAAFGTLALILPEHGAPPVTGALAKAASGALEHVPMIRVVNLARTLERLKTAGFWCVGLDETAERPLAALGLSGRIALVLGSEGEGMRRLVRERCDLLARLPTRGAIAALNVSNAAAIALYELVRNLPE